MNIALFSSEGVYYLLRWFHYFFGIIWIGHLYYFNFTQTPFMAEADAAVKSGVIQKLVPRALWWFRWGAMVTFISGLLMLSMRGHQNPEMFSTAWGVLILTGATLGTLMWANVWFIIWPCQKVIIQNAIQTASGGAAIPETAARAARAAVASRTNTLFSMPMLFFMGAASHLPIQYHADKSHMPLVAVLAVIIGLIQFNAMKGKIGPLATVKGVVHMGAVLMVVLYAVMEVLA